MVVEHNSPVDKHLLVYRLREFVVDANAASRGLQRFGTYIGGAVDQIVSMNKYMLKLLEHAANDPQPPQPLIEPVGHILNTNLPGKRFKTRLTATRRKEVEVAWFQAIDRVESMVLQLIHEAKANVVALDKLEKHLSGIYDTAHTGDGNNHIQPEEVVCHWGSLRYLALTGFWETVGRNMGVVR
jgi:hypothetical protein